MGDGVWRVCIFLFFLKHFLHFCQINSLQGAFRTGIHISLFLQEIEWYCLSLSVENLYNLARTVLTCWVSCRTSIGGIQFYIKSYWKFTPSNFFWRGGSMLKWYLNFPATPLCSGVSAHPELPVQFFPFSFILGLWRSSFQNNLEEILWQRSHSVY